MTFIICSHEHIFIYEQYRNSIEPRHRTHIVGIVLSIHKSECTVNEYERTFNESECTVNESECTVNESECTVNESKCTVNESECTVNESECTVNESECTVNLSSFRFSKYKYYNHNTVKLKALIIDIFALC